MASDRELFLEFQKIWTYDKVKGMSFKDYTDNAGKNRDDFTYWIEVKLQNMGSIWGGSSFKFGIFKYHKKSSSEKVIYDDEYCWLKKYGNSRKQAFENIKDKILQIIKYSENNELEKINDIDLGDMYKWKIAFHYQKHDDMKILDIFSSDIIKKIYEKDFGLSLKNISEFHRKILPDTQKFSLEEVLDKARYYNEKYPEFFRGSKNSKSSNDEDFEEEKITKMPQGENMKNFPLNQILYGPPGTGKTYEVINLALQILGESISENRKENKVKFDEYRQNGQIEFITFHQSYGYEEFVEGIKPVFDDENSQTNELKYEIKNGVFKEICERAKQIQSTQNSKEIDFTKTKIFKMSLGANWGSESTQIYDYCLNNNVIALGWGDNIDFSQCNKADDFKKLDNTWGAKAVEIFKNWMEIGDIVLVSNGNSNIKAIAQITGNYEFNDNAEIEYCQFRKVKWLYSGDDISVSKFYNKKLSQQAIYGFYNLNFKGKDNYNTTINTKFLNDVITGNINKVKQEPYILIIDEINRGNISKIFGELITLVEESKRIGNSEELRVALPYSGKKFDNGKGFGVPKNLYIIGTMNTADRSIALIDTALRRRFEFVEMMPKAEILGEIDGINLRELLKAINERIEFLLDREHVIGHAYFMENKNLGDLKQVFKNKIIPLLQEYFYDDYEKIRAVLNDKDGKFIKKLEQKNLVYKIQGFGDLFDNEKCIYQILEFENLTADDFIKIYPNKSKEEKEQNEQNEPKE